MILLPFLSYLVTGDIWDNCLLYLMFYQQSLVCISYLYAFFAVTSWFIAFRVPVFFFLSRHLIFFHFLPQLHPSTHLFDNAATKLIHFLSPFPLKKFQQQQHHHHPTEKAHHAITQPIIISKKRSELETSPLIIILGLWACARVMPPAFIFFLFCCCGPVKNECCHSFTPGLSVKKTKLSV